MYLPNLTFPDQRIRVRLLSELAHVTYRWLDHSDYLTFASLAHCDPVYKLCGTRVSRYARFRQFQLANIGL